MLRHLTPQHSPDLLVGVEAGDDAAVWRLDDARALVATVDIITPLVDDARTWGRIAAANASSDVYAMGGRPLFALNIVGWNRDELSLELMGEVLDGAAEAAREGGWMAVGGHTIDDPEPKFGQAVIGEVALASLLTNADLCPGDDLVLTKALGIGVISTALKRGEAPDEVVHAAVASMTRLNAEAAAAARGAGARGATDITGFGLLGHLRRMVEASQVAVELDVERVPVLDGVAELAGDGMVPGGTRRNLAWASELLDDGGLDATRLLVLADAQTSGGLLFGAPPEAAASAAEQLRASGHEAAVIGRVHAGQTGISLRTPSSRA